MIRILTAVLLLSLFIGCDDRYDSLKDLNSAPAISLATQSADTWSKLLNDSVKMSRPANAYDPIKIEIADPDNNIQAVRYYVAGGAGTLLFRDSVITAGVPVIGNVGTYQFKPAAPGNLKVTFIVEDRLGASDSAILNLFSFTNLSPIAVLEVNPNSNIQYAYNLDAGGSNDPDRSFGGGIVKYHWTVGANVFDTEQPLVPYALPGPGNYLIKVKVLDNDNVWSKETSLILNIP